MPAPLVPENHRHQHVESEQYCARCGRVDRLDGFGLCGLCRERADVIEIDSSVAPAEQPHPPRPASPLDDVA